MDTDFDLESLVNVEKTCVLSHLESRDISRLMVLPMSYIFVLNLTFYFTIFKRRFYNERHQDGRIHRVVEGRAHGREKGFDMWQELGF